MGCNSSIEQEKLAKIAAQKRRKKRLSHLPQCSKVVLTPKLYQYNVGACGVIMSFEMGLMLQTRNKNRDIYHENNDGIDCEHYVSISNEKKILDDVLQTGMAMIFESHLHTQLFDVIERPRYKGFKILESKFDIKLFDDVNIFIKNKIYEYKKEISFILTQQPETILIHILYKKYKNNDINLDEPIPILFDSHSRFELNLKCAHMLYIKDLNNLRNYITFLWDINNIEIHLIEYNGININNDSSNGDIQLEISNHNHYKNNNNDEIKRDIIMDETTNSDDTAIITNSDNIAPQATPSNMINSNDIESNVQSNTNDNDINDTDDTTTTSTTLDIQKQKLIPSNTADKVNDKILNILMSEPIINPKLKIIKDNKPHKTSNHEIKEDITSYIKTHTTQTYAATINAAQSQYRSMLSSNITPNDVKEDTTTMHNKGMTRELDPFDMCELDHPFENDL